MNERVPGRLPAAGRQQGGPPWMRMGMPTEKSMTFGPSAMRLIGRLRPHRVPLVLVIALGMVSVLMSVLVPKILGRATDVIFTGVIGRQLPAGVTVDQAVAGARAAGNDNYADMLARMDVVPGAGIDFDQLAHVLTHPQYSNFTDLDNWNDVGVVVLDRPAVGLTPATVAPRNYLDGFGQPTLNSTLFTLVGYGTEVRKPDAGPQKPQPMSFPLLRRLTTGPGQKLTPQIVQLNGNPADVRGGGGTCFGDSGGPAFLNGYLVAVTSYGYTLNCRYLGGFQRVDIPVAQDWLATVG